MQRKALVPLIVFDVGLNVYLTSLFLHPLRRRSVSIHGTLVGILKLEHRVLLIQAKDKLSVEDNGHQNLCRQLRHSRHEYRQLECYNNSQWRTGVHLFVPV